MGTRQAEIVAAIDAAHRELKDLVKGASPEQWTMPGVNHPEIRRGEDERRPVGVIVHHLASAYAATLDRCAAWTRGENPAPPTQENNTRHAAANPHPDQSETISLLEANVTRLTDFARGLTDEQLDATGDFVQGESTVARMLGSTTPYHIRWHAGSIRATWEQKART